VAAIGTPERVEERFTQVRHLARASVRGLAMGLGATSLTKDELRDQYAGRNFVAGWRFRIRFEESERCLDLLVDPAFPFLPPRIALVDRPAFLTWPHVEKDGMLCLLADSTPTDCTTPARLAEALLADAIKLVSGLEKGEYLDHFRDEFLTYWRQSSKLGVEFFSLLQNGQRRNRPVYAWIGANSIFVGEEPSDVTTWLEHRFGCKPKFKKTDECLFIWLGGAPLPTEYPKTPADIMTLLLQTGSEALFTKLLSPEKMVQSILLGFETNHGDSLVAVTLYKRTADKQHPKLRGRVGSGFRPGRVPAHVLMSQFLAASGKVIPSMVERIDHNWVHGRDSDPHQTSLKKAAVAVFGCGSLGGFVAHQLAMAGVGTLYLVDPQTLTSSNSGRHFLGSRYLGKSKALSLATELQQNFPHLTVRGFQMDWEEFRRMHVSEFEAYSLVLSLTGDWNSEVLLNSVHLQSARTQDFIYGWTEAHASAGHAVLIRSVGGCFCCHFDSLGNAKRRLVLGTEETRRQEPACGALFQPYGPVELSSTVSLISDLALDALLKHVDSSTHRIWKGSGVRLRELGGDWDQEVVRKLGIADFDYLRHSTEWRKVEDCFMCGGLG
jgi:sulfur-carrier protein adenylyltransferase/sulfurtransferase